VGSRGPAPKPAQLRLVTGKSPGHDVAGRPVELPPPFTRGAPEPPAWLGEYAREVWANSIIGLVGLKLVKPEDFASFAAYCEAVEQFRDATLDIRRRGMILEVLVKGVRFVEIGDGDYDAEEATVRGYGYFVPAPAIERKLNPAVTAQDKAATRIRAFAREFGLTPSAESALAGLNKDSAIPAGDVSPFAGIGS
jgi:P27 family predicted phage terminase small subunit